MQDYNIRILYVKNKCDIKWNNSHNDLKNIFNDNISFIEKYIFKDIEIDLDNNFLIKKDADINYNEVHNDDHNDAHNDADNDAHNNAPNDTYAHPTNFHYTDSYKDTYNDYYNKIFIISACNVFSERNICLTLRLKSCSQASLWFAMSKNVDVATQIFVYSW